MLIAVVGVAEMSDRAIVSPRMISIDRLLYGTDMFVVRAGKCTSTAMRRQERGAYV